MSEIPVISNVTQIPPTLQGRIMQRHSMWPLFTAETRMAFHLEEMSSGKPFPGRLVPFTATERQSFPALFSLADDRASQQSHPTPPRTSTPHRITWISIDGRAFLEKQEGERSTKLGSEREWERDQEGSFPPTRCWLLLTTGDNAGWEAPGVPLRLSADIVGITVLGQAARWTSLVGATEE